MVDVKAQLAFTRAASELKTARLLPQARIDELMAIIRKPKVTNEELLLAQGIVGDALTQITLAPDRGRGRSLKNELQALDHALDDILKPSLRESVESANPVSLRERARLVVDSASEQLEAVGTLANAQIKGGLDAAPGVSYLAAGVDWTPRWWPQLDDTQLGDLKMTIHREAHHFHNSIVPWGDGPVADKGIFHISPNVFERAVKDFTESWPAIRKPCADPTERVYQKLAFRHLITDLFQLKVGYAGMKDGYGTAAAADLDRLIAALLADARK